MKGKRDVCSWALALIRRAKAQLRTFGDSRLFWLNEKGK